MLIREKSCRERLIRVRRKHRYNRLPNDCAAVKHRRNKVHGRAVYPAAGVNGTLMRVKSRKERQKCRMNIEDFAFPAGDKRLREDTHEASQYDDRGLIRFDRGSERFLKSFACRISLVVNGNGINAFAPGGVKTFGKGAVGDHRRNFEAEPALPVFAASRAQYGFKVAASAGNQDDDVLHDVIEKKCIDAALIEIECARERPIF